MIWNPGSKNFQLVYCKLERSYSHQHWTGRLGRSLKGFDRDILLVFPVYFPNPDFMLMCGDLFFQGTVPSSIEEVSVVVFHSFSFIHKALPPSVHDSCIYWCSLIARTFWLASCTGYLVIILVLSTCGWMCVKSGGPSQCWNIILSRPGNAWLPRYFSEQ